MGISQSFDGARLSVKLSWLTLAQLDAAKGEGARENMVREWVENWRTLANLSPFLYQRLVYAAQQRRLPLDAIVNEALTQYCSQLPGIPPHVKVSTPIDLIETDAEPEKKAPRKAGSAKK